MEPERASVIAAPVVGKGNLRTPDVTGAYVYRDALSA